MPELVVVDTSCLIALTRINHLSILHQVYGTLTITPAIQKEFKLELPAWVHVSSAIIRKEELTVINALVDPGEASAIAFCVKRQNSLLIIDDSKGRKLAKKLGVRVTGTLGVLAKAKQKGYINAIKPYIDALERADFRFSAKLREVVLKSVGE